MAAPGSWHPALPQILLQLFLLQVWPWGTANLCDSRVNLNTSKSIDIGALVLICNPCVSVQDIVCSGSECDWAADGFLCPSALICTDHSFGTSSQEGYWWSLAQILLLYCQPNGVPVFTLYWDASCTLYWYVTQYLLRIHISLMHIMVQLQSNGVIYKHFK